MTVILLKSSDPQMLLREVIDEEGDGEEVLDGGTEQEDKDFSAEMPNPVGDSFLESIQRLLQLLASDPSSYKNNMSFFSTRPDGCKNIYGYLPEGFVKMEVPASFEGSINCVVGNSSLEEADIVFLGDEDHENPWMRAEIRRLYECFAQPSSPLLVELAPESVEEVRSATCRYFQQQAERYGLVGWDNLELQQKAYALIDRDLELQALKDRVLRLLRETDDDGERVVLQKQLTDLHGLMKECRSQMDHVSIVERNGSMVQTITQFEGSGKRLFVLTGLSHVNEALIETFKGKKIVYIDFRAETTPATAAGARGTSPIYYPCQDPLSGKQHFHHFTEDFYTLMQT